MNNKRINLIGVSDHSSGREMQPGECARIVNLTKVNNTLCPTPTPAQIGGMAYMGRKVCYIHLCNNLQHIISTDGDSLFHEADYDGTSTTTKDISLTTLDSPITSISSLGQTLIATTACQVYYFLYKKDAYIALGNNPPMPIIRFNEVNIQNEGVITDAITYQGRVEKIDASHHEEFSNLILGSLYKIRDEIHKQHGFFAPVVVRYALRLYDGNHILPSPPIVVGLNNYNYCREPHYLTFHYNEATDTTMLMQNVFLLDTMGIEYYIESIDLANWSDIVTGVDIFVSRELAMIEDSAIDNGSYYDKSGNKSEYVYKYQIPLVNTTSIEQALRDETLFYHLATIDIDKATIKTPTLIKHETRTDLIIYRPRLTTDTTNFNRIGARVSYVYNNRLHLADISKEYFKGYNPILFQSSINESSSNALVRISTRITLENGGVDDVAWNTSIPYFDYKLSPLLSYPDGNAISITLTIRHDGYEYHKTFPLKCIDNENRASYIDPNIQMIDVTTWDKTEITPDSLNNFNTPPSTIQVGLRNRMLVSQVNNPFFFPAELSFDISKGAITGIATTTMALSQGQYGEFPLYIFTEEGVWTMQVGSDDVCYSRCNPLNNEIHNIGSLLLSAGAAIIYRSGNKLLALTGAESSVLLSLDEIIPSAFYNDISTLSSKLTPAATDATSLSDYLAGKISAIYNHKSNELMLCNPDFSYSLVLHLPTGHLYRRQQSFSTIVSNGSAMLAQGNNGLLYDLGRDVISQKQVAIVTQPIQPAPDTYARLRQVMWRMQGSYCNISLYILAAHQPHGQYGIIHHATYDGRVIGHLPLRIWTAPYKYYRLILAGSVSHDFSIDCIDLSYDLAENNKLR
ncbi:MAG: hypothetical protein E7084_04095 [Bacteroidales bacterium]|nr:hypothetical protein [Bacteroidales bacterium]